MATSGTSVAVPPAAVSADPATVEGPASRPWLLAALLLAAPAQLITISALARYNPVAPSWWALLLAAAPAPLTAAAVFAPVRYTRLAAGAALVALIAGIIGGILHLGLFFVPALVVLAMGTAQLWREPR